MGNGQWAWYMCMSVCGCASQREREGDSERGSLNFISQCQYRHREEKNRIVSSILGIKAKPSVIVSTILTAVNRP